MLLKKYSTIPILDNGTHLLAGLVQQSQALHDDSPVTLPLHLCLACSP
jgi:hypothetical protein